MKKLNLKTLLCLALSLAVIISLLAGCGSSNNGAQQGSSGTPAATEKNDGKTESKDVIHLSLSNQWGANAYINSTILPQWIAALEEATNGEYTIDVYPANTLTATTENYEGVVNGISDLGMVTFSATPNRFPVVEAFMLPGVANFNNASGAGYALNELLDTMKPAEVQDTKLLFAFSTGANVLVSSDPITSLEDMKGLSLGSTQAERATAMTLMGANPVSLSMPEWFEALQKGMIVGGITSPEALEGFSLYEVTGDYLLDWNYFNTSMFYCAMNIDTYNSLSPEAKAFFDTDPAVIIEAWDYLVPRAIDTARQHKDVVINTLSEEENQRWLDTLAPMVEENIAALNSKGMDGAAVHKTIKELTDKYNELYPHSLLGE